MDVEVRQPGDERHLHGHVVASNASHRPLEDAGLAQDRERALVHGLPRRLRVGAVVDCHAETFGDLPLDLDHVIDQVAHVPVGARRRVRPLAVGHGVEAGGEAGGRLFVAVDDVHGPIIPKRTHARARRPAAGQEPSGTVVVRRGVEQSGSSSGS